MSLMNPDHKLFKRSADESDARSGFFAMASLMMILLPTLLMVTNPQKIVTVPLSLSNVSGTFTPTHTGMVEKISIIATSTGFLVEMNVRKSDVLAASGNTELKSWTMTNWDSVLLRLREIETIDPEQHKIYVRPTSKNNAQTVIGWLDSLQLNLSFDNVVLEHPE